MHLDVTYSWRRTPRLEGPGAPSVRLEEEVGDVYSQRVGEQQQVRVSRISSAGLEPLDSAPLQTGQVTQFFLGEFGGLA